MPEEVNKQSRVRPTYARGERELLDRWLEFHRATLIAKCEGLTDQQRKDRPVASSELSLHGLVRHLAETERNWFQRVLLRDLDRPPIWAAGALVPLDEASWSDDLDVWRAQRVTRAAGPRRVAAWTITAFGETSRSHCDRSTFT